MNLPAIQRDLFSRINMVIDLIPTDFPKRDDLVIALKRRQDSVPFSDMGNMNLRISEVVRILDEHLSLSEDHLSQEQWVVKIAEIMSKKYE